MPWNNAVRTRGVFTHRADFLKPACVERGLVRTGPSWGTQLGRLELGHRSRAPEPGQPGLVRPIWCARQVNPDGRGWWTAKELQRPCVAEASRRGRLRRGLRGGGLAARVRGGGGCGGDFAAGTSRRGRCSYLPHAWNNAVEQCRAHQGRFHSPRCFSEARVRRKGSGAHGNEPGRQNWDTEAGRHEAGRPCLVRTAPNLWHRNWTARAGGRQRNFSDHAWRTMGTWNQPQIVSDSGLGISGCSRTGIHASSF